jgi:uncharacterized protein (DUF2141 family)
MKSLASLSILICFIPLISPGQQTGNIHLIVQNIENKTGVLRIGLFTETDIFLEEASWSKDIAVEGHNKIEIDFENIPYGIYAISIYHDLDNNDKLDTNMIGIPKEPVGFSNDHRPRMGPPKFKGAKFDLARKNLTMTVNLYTY